MHPSTHGGTYPHHHHAPPFHDQQQHHPQHASYAPPYAGTSWMVPNTQWLTPNEPHAQHRQAQGGYMNQPSSSHGTRGGRGGGGRRAAGGGGGMAAGNGADMQPTENLFLCYLPSSMDDMRLQHLVGQYGVVRSAKVMLDLNTKMSRGFGFALMATVDDAARARSALDGLAVDGKRLQVRFAEPPASDRPTSSTSPTLGAVQGESGTNRETPTNPTVDARGEPTNLYVKGIPLSWSDAHLAAFFAPHGAVASAVVLMEGRESKGIGLVRFERHEDVARVLAAAPLHVEGWSQPITVRYSRQAPSASGPANSASKVASATTVNHIAPPTRTFHNNQYTEVDSGMPAQRQHTDVYSPHAADDSVAAAAAAAQHDAASRMVPGPFGMLLRMNNPYNQAHRSKVSTPNTDGPTLTTSTSNPNHTLSRSTASATRGVGDGATVIRDGTMPSPQQQRVKSQMTNFAPLPQTLASACLTSSQPVPPSAFHGHCCPYCQLGTTVRVRNVPEDPVQFEQWVDGELSGFGAVAAREVGFDGSGLITFVDPGAAHMAIQLLMNSAYEPELFDCADGYSTY